MDLYGDYSVREYFPASSVKLCRLSLLPSPRVCPCIVWSGPRFLTSYLDRVRVAFQISVPATTGVVILRIPYGVPRKTSVSDIDSYGWDNPFGWLELL